MLLNLARTGKRIVKVETSKFLWRNSSHGRHAAENFKALHNVGAGKDAIIMCNGPSLNKVPLETLAGRFVIGMNKINLMFDRSDFRPDMIVAVNKYVIEQNADFYNSTDIPLMLSYIGADYVRPRSSLTFLNSYAKSFFFSLNPAAILCERATVTYTALQIAFHMGFARVALVGADHNFNQVGKPNELQVSKSDDPNHFDPRYFGTGTPWQLADLEGSDRAYECARDVYEKHGRELFNCTDGGKLECLKRVSLSEFLATSEPQNKR
jgi:hypothetical protein